MQPPKYSPSILTLKRTLTMYTIGENEKETYFKLAKEGQSERAPTNAPRKMDDK
jgi:hypothetical protein